ncbi:SDR family oxidoreductase [Idiomarina xiamenensis]|uniref:NAD-dependent epimerase/dehydratase n=1 Tax=Idiomarina xiamenensis 10-D-4 TaxID=740709 RepID=K2KA95_9GAMM|nr:SDR family oxidoreductase [Idiomarina xiamenensis]EKE84708.1 NAD-dependent epimerase/dehydratase [Idiomarina xiamenensis 10-D-4]
MKVAVFGANGKIGRQVVEQLNQHERHQARAVVRKQQQLEQLKADGVEAVMADLEDDVEQLREAIGDADAVVFSAGSGGSTGADKTLLIDLDGAVKVMEATEQAGVSRFIIVSAMQAHNRDNWPDELRSYYVAKHYADRLLRATPLQYTVIRPGALTDEAGTGRVQLREDLPRGEIARADVATVIVRAVDCEASYRQSFDLLTGDTPISELWSN